MDAAQKGKKQMSRRNRKLKKEPPAKKDKTRLLSASAFCLCAIFGLVVDVKDLYDLGGAEGLSKVFVHAALLTLSLALFIKKDIAVISAMAALSGIKLYLFVYDVVLPMSRDELMMFTEEQLFVSLSYFLYAAAFVSLILFSFDPAFLKKAREKLFPLPAAVILLSFLCYIISFHNSAGSDSFNATMTEFVSEMAFELLTAAGAYFYAKYRLSVCRENAERK